MNLGKLREWAGIATFERGEWLAKHQHVLHYHNHNRHITAQVQGTYLYDVSISGGNNVECTCPAAAYQPICKHAVATLLVHGGHYAQAQTPLEALALTLPDDVKVHQWLASLDKERLLEMLHNQITDNPTLFEALQYRCYVDTHNESLTTKQVIALIDEALPYDSAWEYDEAHAYFDSLNDKFHALDHALAALPNEDAYLVAWHGIKRLNTICIDYVDSTSGGYQTTLALFSQHMIDALTDSDTALTDKLSFIIQVIEAQIDIDESFLKTLGNKAPALSLALAQALQSDALVEHLPPSTTSDICRHYCQASAAKEQWQDAIAWLLNTELRWHDWLKMGQYHLKLAQYSQAQHCLIQAENALQDPDHSSLIDFACELATSQGQNAKAWQIRWQQFEVRPHFAKLQALQPLMATERKQREQQQSDVIERLLKYAKSSTRHSRGIELLVNTALDYHRTDILLEWAHHEAIDSHLSVQVADALTPEHYDMACKLYRTAIENKVEQTNNGGYLEAVKLIARFKTMANDDKEQHDLTWHRLVKQLKKTMSRKRNFIRYLDERFTVQ